jgi:hypothetical protein
MLFRTLLLVGGLLPLAAMLVALFAAAWLRRTPSAREPAMRQPGAATPPTARR